MRTLPSPVWRWLPRLALCATACSSTVALALEFSGDLQVIGAQSRDRTVQRSLVETSAYIEAEVTEDLSGFLVAYHDQEFRSIVVGVAKKLGPAQFGFGLGEATYSGGRHFMFNPWLALSDDSYKAYMHAEHYGNEPDSPWWYKAYALKKVGRFSAGLYYDSNLGLGPRLDIRVFERVSASFTVAATRRPKAGAMKSLVGVTIDF